MSDVADPPPTGDPGAAGDDPTEQTERAAAGRRAGRAAWDRLLDAVVYVPIGFAAETVEQLPHWAAKGRDRLGVQLSNARVTGQYVVRKAERDVGHRVTRLLPVRRSRPPTRGAGAGAPERSGETPIAALPGDAPHRGTGPGAGPVALPSDRATSAAAAAAIEGYDTLSASQVVRRLDGLGPEELRAVYRHEAATRGRRTILHRVQQLLQPPAPAPPPATPASAGVPTAANGTSNGDGTAEPT